MSIAPTITLAVLDDPQEWSAFSRPCSDNAALWESSVVIEGMHCAACSVTVEDALRAMPGVMSARVSAASQRATVRWSPEQVLPSQWMRLRDSPHIPGSGDWGVRLAGAALAASAAWALWMGLVNNTAPWCATV